MRAPFHFLQVLVQWWQTLHQTLLVFPWGTTLRTLRERFREDRLGVTASSLTFTTTIALVPVMTVLLAAFTAFPMFAKLQVQLQQWLVASLIPESIARQVLGYLTQFAGKASKLGGLGLGMLFVTALALVLTIDRTLNSIWRVRKPRPMSQRVLVYWALMTLGPLVLAGSVSLTSYALSASKGLVGHLPGGLELLLASLQFLVFAWGMAALYHYVPNTQVRWVHAWSGGVFVALSMELAKTLLVAYLDAMPLYSAVYGTFATLPILLVWIYTAWVIVLLGAVVAAYLPTLLSGIARDAGGAPGWSFQLALEVLQLLHGARQSGQTGLTLHQLSERMRVDMLQLEVVVQALLNLDWLGRLQEVHAAQTTSRLVLLADPPNTPLAPLVSSLLLAHTSSTRRFVQASGWTQLYLKDVL
jgi:membrane protein